MRTPLLLLSLCLLLTASLAEAQYRRSAQPRLSVMPGQTSNNNTGNAGVAADIKSTNTTGLTHDRNHVLLVGVNDYLQTKPDESRPDIAPLGFPNLRFCRKDMEGFQDALVKSRFCKAEDIRLLVSGAGGENEPTKANVEKAFREMLSKVQRGDRVLVAFSGHGILSPSERNPERWDDFLCCADTVVTYNTENGQIDNRKGLISRTWVEESLDRSAADVKLFFVDACRNEPNLSSSSASGNSGSRAAARSSVQLFGAGVANTYAPSTIQKQGLYRFSSSMTGEVSYEHPDVGHGVFAHFLIEGMLGKALLPGKDRITLMDLEFYVRRQTSEYVENIPPARRLQQNPVLTPLPNPDTGGNPRTVVFSYPYTPGSEPVPTRPEPEPVPPPPVLIAERRLSQEELNALMGRYSGLSEFLENTRNVPGLNAQNQRDQDILALRALRNEITNFNGRRPQDTWNQQQIDGWNAVGHALQVRINAWNDRQQELERQREVIAQRYRAEINNFAQGSASRVQEVAGTASPAPIINAAASFDNARPEGVLTQQQLDTWNQTGRTLQRNMDTWMTSTSPKVVNFNPQRPSAATGGYRNPNIRGNSSQGMR